MNKEVTLKTAPDGLSEYMKLSIAALISTGAKADKLMKENKETVDSTKKEVKTRLLAKQIPAGKYITSDGYTMTIVAVKEYEGPDSSEVLNYLMENKIEYSFKDLFSIGYEKLKGLIGNKADQFRKLLPDDGVRISFK